MEGSGTRYEIEFKKKILFGFVHLALEINSPQVLKRAELVA